MKSLIYYREGEVIGVRKHMFDWKPGDEILTNGRKTTVYAVFEQNERNKALVKDLFRVLGSKKRTVVCDAPEDFFDGFPEDLKPLAVKMMSHTESSPRFTFDEKFEILDKYLDHFTEIEFEEYN